MQILILAANLDKHSTNFNPRLGNFALRMCLYKNLHWNTSYSVVMKDQIVIFSLRNLLLIASSNLRNKQELPSICSFFFFLRVLVEELQDSLVSALILLAHLGVLQVRSCSHPAVDLIRESLDMLGDLQVCLKVLDILDRLVS